MLRRHLIRKKRVKTKPNITGCLSIFGPVDAYVIGNGDQETPAMTKGWGDISNAVLSLKFNTIFIFIFIKNKIFEY